MTFERNYPEPHLLFSQYNEKKDMFMKLRVFIFAMLFLLTSCGDNQEVASDANATDGESAVNLDEGSNDTITEPGGETPDETDDAATRSDTVTFTVYIDEDCTELPPSDSVVHLSLANACNVAPKASINDLICYNDRITYTNYPNILDCSGEGFFNELLVGVCQQFPGPVATWKYIEPSTYNCGSPE